jgi:hypothetical protein
MVIASPVTVQALVELRHPTTHAILQSVEVMLNAVSTRRNGQFTTISRHRLANLSPQPRDLHCSLLVDDASGIRSGDLATGMAKDGNKVNYEVIQKFN